jgi:biofilm PGA synthesis protein PgaD
MIIAPGDLRSRWKRVRDGVLTFAMWLAYLWLISDAFVLLAHVWRWLIRHDARPEELNRFFAILGTIQSYAVVIIVNATLFVGWALYNQLRFRGKERRKAAPSLAVAELAEFYHRPAAEIEAWQDARVATVTHDAAGGIEAVRIHSSL